MRWTWDANKARANQRKHGLSLETAQRVFDDPPALSRVDRDADEERWQTVGMIEGVVVLVVHTWHEADSSGEGGGRIIGARKATRH